MNLLRVRWIKSLLASRWFPIVPQLIMLVFLALLIAGGLGITTDDKGFAKVLRNTNLANLLVWSYWWPVIIIVAILFGRFWCMVCPMELATSLASRIGLRRKVPKFFKSGWVITIFYTLILIVGLQSLAIHRLPHRMSLYLLMLVALSILVGLIYRKRAFCSYVCPVGHLLGMYALISPFEWRADDKSVCDRCKTKDCFVKKNQYKLFGRSCTSNLYPATIKDNRDCLLCTQCLKACPYDNLRLSTRRPFADFFLDLKIPASQLAFILLVSGFVIYEIISEWSVSKSILTWVPTHLADILGITGQLTGPFNAIVMFLIYPAILFLAVTAIVKILQRIPSRDVITAFALMLLPTMAAAHITKSILKMASRIPYWTHSLSDPAGIKTTQQILDQTLVLDQAAPKALYSTVSLTATALFVIALPATYWISKKSPALNKFKMTAKVILFLGALTYWSIFTVMIFQWRF